MKSRPVHKFQLNPTSLSGNCQWCDYPESHENHDKPTPRPSVPQQGQGDIPLESYVLFKCGIEKRLTDVLCSCGKESCGIERVSGDALAASRSEEATPQSDYPICPTQKLVFKCGAAGSTEREKTDVAKVE